MRRFFWLSLLAAILGLSSVALSAQQRGQSPSQIKLQHNRRTAHADALHLLESIRLPAGTQRTTAITEHRGFVLSAVMTSYTASAKYLTPADVNAYRYVIDHRPHGTTYTTGGTYRILENGKHRFISRTIYMTFPNRKGVLFVREAVISVRKLKNGKTRVGVASQSSWLIPRPSSEKVPRAVTQVVISGTTRTRHGNSTWSVSPVTAAAQVHKLVRLVDRPGITQDVVMNCPADPGPAHSVRLAFDNANGATLATVGASWWGGDGAYATGTPCSPLTFSLGPKREPSLADPNFLAQLHKLTGIRLER